MERFGRVLIRVVWILVLAGLILGLQVGIRLMDRRNYRRGGGPFDYVSDWLDQLTDWVE